MIIVNVMEKPIAGMNFLNIYWSGKKVGMP